MSTHNKIDDEVLVPAVFNEPNKVQRALVYVAYVSYVLAACCAIYAIGFKSGLSKAVFASFLASVIFFLGAGIVMHVIGKCSIPSLKVT